MQPETVTKFRRQQGRYRDEDEENKTKFDAKNRICIRCEHKRDTMRMPETFTARNPRREKLEDKFVRNEHPHERERCSGRNTRTPVQQEMTRKLDSQTSRAEEVCLNNACMNDVHMTSPHDSSRPPARHNHRHDTTTKGWGFGGSSPWTSHHPSA